MTKSVAEIIEKAMASGIKLSIFVNSLGSKRIYVTFEVNRDGMKIEGSQDSGYENKGNYSVTDVVNQAWDKLEALGYRGMPQIFTPMIEGKKIEEKEEEIPF